MMRTRRRRATGTFHSLLTIAVVGVVGTGFVNNAFPVLGMTSVDWHPSGSVRTEPSPSRGRDAVQTARAIGIFAARHHISHVLPGTSNRP